MGSREGWGVAREAEGAAARVAAHPARQGVLRHTVGLVQGWGQPGLAGASHPVVGPAQPVGIRGSIGGKNGRRGGGAVGALILGPHQARRCRSGVESRRRLEGHVSAIGWDHLAAVHKSIGIGVHVDVVVVVVAVAGGSVAEGGAGRAVISQTGAAVVTAKVRVGRGTPQRAGAVVAVVGERLATGGGRDARAGLAPQAGVPVQVETHVGAIGVEVVLVCELDEAAGAHGDVCFNLFPGPVHILRHARHLKHGLFVPAGCDDVGVRLLLDALDSGPLGSHHQTHHPIGNSHLNGGLARQIGRAGHCGVTIQGAVFVPRGSDHREVLGRRDDLPPGHGYILSPACHNKDWLLSPHWSFDIRIGLCSQGFNFATYNCEKSKKQK